MSDIIVHIIDREGVQHDVAAPTDMNMNLMEVCQAYQLPIKGTCGGMAMCASCHCYIESGHVLNEPSEDEEDMLDQAFSLRITADWVAKSSWKKNSKDWLLD